MGCFSCQRFVYRFSCALILTLVALASPVPAFGQSPFNVAEARKSVVLIKRITPGLGPAVGTGFLVDQEGLIYTNRHVAVPSDENIQGSILVVGVPKEGDADALEYFRASIVHVPQASADLDFAVLKIAAHSRKFRPLPLSHQNLELGTDVAVLGYPFVEEDQPNISFTKGSVSATRVRLGDRSYYQTDAAINPGNSGGPLLNSKGEVVGIITFRKRNAVSVGFALHLSEVANAAKTARANAAKVKVSAGPLDKLTESISANIAPVRENWGAVDGNVRQLKGALVLEKNGGEFSITSKEPLPQNFQLVIRCRIEFLQGGQRIYFSQRSILRSLCVRFDTPKTGETINTRVGTLIRFSSKLLLLFKEGAGDAVDVAQKGNTDEPFTFVVTRKDGDYTIAVDGEILLKYHDDNPLKGGHRFSIGGYLSRLYLGDVSVIDLDRNSIVTTTQPDRIRQREQRVPRTTRE